MRAPLGRAFAFLVILLAPSVVPPARVVAQQPAPRGITFATEPLIQTKLEALLTMPDAVLTADYYRIDTRFGPSVLLDAVVVTAIDLKRRLRGLRVGLRDEGKPVSRSGLSFLDIEEGASLSRALTSMSEIAGKWTGREDQRSTDVSFTTVGGFTVGVHLSFRVQRAFLSSGFIDPVRTSIEFTDLLALKVAVDQALAELADK